MWDSDVADLKQLLLACDLWNNSNLVFVLFFDSFLGFLFKLFFY